jgi:hypothetical protein
VIAGFVWSGVIARRVACGRWLRVMMFATSDRVSRDMLMFESQNEGLLTVSRFMPLTSESTS